MVLELESRRQLWCENFAKKKKKEKENAIKNTSKYQVCTFFFMHDHAAVSCPKS